MKKCESCRFFVPKGPRFEDAGCSQINVRRPTLFAPPESQPVAIRPAREVCNKEGDGIFVYFEPSYPSAGAAFADRRPARRAAGGVI